jgi:cytoskeletal protein RodZ
MSERDNADRLNREWDDFVRSPRAARSGKQAIDPTVSELFAADEPQSPDPDFRLQLRQQLLREAAFQSGQQRAATGHASHGAPPLPQSNHLNRWLEIFVIAAVVLLIGAAAIWATQIRGDRDENITPTFQLAAASPSLIIGTPLPSSTATVPATPTVPATSDATPTVPTTGQPVVIPSTPQASPTAQADVCTDVEIQLETLVSTLAGNGLPPELTNGTLADAQAVQRIESATTEFTGCLELIPPADIYALVRDSLEKQGVPSLEQATIAQQVAGLTTPGWTVSEARLLTGNQASALITLPDGTQFIGIFDEVDNSASISLTSLYIPHVPEPTATSNAPVATTAPPPPDNIPSDDDSDDDDSAGSGSDDDDDGGGGDDD